MKAITIGDVTLMRLGKKDSFWMETTWRLIKMESMWKNLKVIISCLRLMRVKLTHSNRI